MKIKENAIKVLEQRYLLKDEDGNLTESVEGLFKRVAGAVAGAERNFQSAVDPAKIEEEFYNMMTELEFLPNSPTLMNAGTGIGQLSACFVLPVEDSMEDIFESVKNTALIQKSGGGTGFSFTKLRQEGAMVSSTGGVASGPISFMKVFNASTDVIKQGGKRRGANMGILNVDHPDILAFIDCKKDNNELNNFNISVGITEKFMEAVKAGEEYDLIDPHTQEVTGKLNAKEVFDKIVDAAWRNGEPGILFVDRMERDNIVPKEGKLYSTNPCVTGDTLILTDEGYVPIIECVGKHVKVWNGREWSEVVPRKTGENQDLLKITMSDGHEVVCTPYHKFVLSDGEKVEAKDLRAGDKMTECDFPLIEGGKELKNAYTQGFFAGDGFNGSGRPAKYISFYNGKRDCKDYCALLSCRENSEKRETYKVDVEHEKEFVPNAEYTVKSRLDWLAGLMDSDGGMTVDGSVSISSVSREFLTQTQYMLETLGIHTTVNIMKKEESKYFPEGCGGNIYHCRSCYRISIAASDIIALRELGLETHRHKIGGISINRAAKRKLRVRSVEMLDEKEDVYCFTEEKLHMGVFNGIYTAQCGEQPLLPYESCNLGSINLSNMVITDETGKASFDSEKIKKVTRLAVRFLDDVIEINKYPIDIIDKQTKKTRKVGLGVMGWADALLKLGIPYNSKQACDLAENIMHLIREEATEESKRLAKERGAFPLFLESVFTDAGEEPRRNGTVTTIAPTGTLSIIAGCSSGVEPVFAYVYIRKVMDGTELPEVNPILEKVLKKRGLYSDELMRKIAKQGTLAHIDEIPDDIKEVFVSAHDISPKDHIRMQAAFQKYTDNAVSKTVNFPKAATRDEVAEVYMLAYEMGCKGTTIYRDGSRDEQVLNIGKTEDKDESADNLPAKRERPKMVTGVTERMRIGCGNLYVTVNCDKNGLCEVLTTTGKHGGCPSQSDATAMLISLALRSGIEPETIINELRGIRCPSTISKSGMDCLSCPDAIARVMKKEFEKEKMLNEDAMSLYDAEWEEEEEAEEENSAEGFSVCPQCNERSLTYQSGCVICINCGYSKCT